jgi:Bacterial membrane protein YfhO
VPPPDVLFQPDDVVSFLQSQQGGRFRVWVLPFPAGATYRQDDYLMHFDMDQAGGEHGNQLQRYNEYLGAGTKTYVDWHNFLQYPVFMDADNVRFLIAGVGLKIPGFKEVHRGQYAIIYENQQAMPRAYLVPDVQVVKPPDGAITAMHSDAFDPTQTALLYAPPPQPLPSGPLQGSATITRYEPDHVDIRTQANREAMLVLADTYYADWVVAVDGQTAPMLRVNHAFRGVEVPAGTHTVTFDFRPRSLYIGFRIYLACLALLALYGAYAGLVLWRRRRSPSPA